LRAAGAEVICLPGTGGHVDLNAVINHLAQAAVNEVHVEAGATLNAALLKAGLVNELLLYLAPVLLGSGGRPISLLGPFDHLNDGIKLQIVDLQPVGTDVRVRAHVIA
jgi:diaminohydroxyphosphoribosylaminopyrimidine deaminase/5-amino-6-(5-phosphoribosylamino)uracil reductase